jgi:hypothetical protein
MNLLMAYNFEVNEGHVVAPNFYRACVSEIFPQMGISTSYLPDVRSNPYFRLLRFLRVSEPAARLLVLACWLIVAHRKFDVVVGWSTAGLLAAALRALCHWRRPRTCVILYQLDLNRRPGMVNWLRARFIRLASRGCDLLLTLDADQAGTFERTLARRPGTTAALRYGVAAKWYAEQRSRLSVAAGTSRLVFCPGGAHRDERTIREAVAGLDVDIYRCRLEAPGQQVVIEERVGAARWHSVVNAPFDDYLRACLQSAMVVIPVESHDKPVGLTALLECMALGRAVIITRGASSNDYVQDGITGLIYESGDAARLRELIQRLLSEPQAAARMGDAAAIESHRRFGLERCGTQFGQLLLDLDRAPSSTSATVSKSTP